jgi:hypothetical protein
VVLDFARTVHGDGFTVLVPDLDGGAEPARLTSAAEFLVDNWHPRLGVVGFGEAVAVAGQIAEERACDALVLYCRDEVETSSLRAPILRHHVDTASAASDETLEFLHHHLS